ERNAALNGVSERVRTFVHDLAHPLPSSVGAFDHVVSNPPYLAAAVADPSPNVAKALATVESSASLARWLEVATSVLKPPGTLTIIHRSDGWEEIPDPLSRLGWGARRVKPLMPAQRVLVRAHRTAQPARRSAPPLVLHRPDGGYTEEAEAILRH